MAGIFVGVGRGGCRSSVELGVEATTAVAMRGWHLRLLRGAVRTWVCSVGRYGDCGHDGEGLRRQRVSVVGEAAAMARKRARERGEKRQGLM